MYLICREISFENNKVWHVCRTNITLTEWINHVTNEWTLASEQKTPNKKLNSLHCLTFHSWLAAKIFTTKLVTTTFQSWHTTSRKHWFNRNKITCNASQEIGPTNNSKCLPKIAPEVYQKEYLTLQHKKTTLPQSVCLGQIGVGKGSLNSFLSTSKNASLYLVHFLT